MFIYTRSYTESHRSTRNINLEHKTHQKHQITFFNITFFQTPIFSKNRHYKSALYAEFYNTIYIDIIIMKKMVLEVGGRGGNP